MINQLLCALCPTRWYALSGIIIFGSSALYFHIRYINEVKKERKGKK